MKKYTTLEQSKKLCEAGIDLSTADMFYYWDYDSYLGADYFNFNDIPNPEPYLKYTRHENEWKESHADIPCWSFGGLLEILPTTIKGYELVANFEDETYKYIDKEDGAVLYSTESSRRWMKANPGSDIQKTDLLDAIVEMVMFLKSENVI